MKTIGRICNIQPFSVHDGPGIRTAFFMKGCNLRCFWCHNPESQDSRGTVAFFPHKCIGCGECAKVCPNADGGRAAFHSEACTLCGRCAEECFAEAIELIGRDITADDAFDIIKKDKELFVRSGGGVTFSGGEPLLQPDFIAEVMQKCKAEGIHTAVESAVCVTWESIEKILPYCDAFICDLKHADSEKHKIGTGASNERIIENLKRLADTGKLYEVRTPIIPGFNDSAEDVKKINEIIKGFGKGVPHRLLPFHSICASKYESQGRVFEAANIAEPTKEKMNQLNSLINGG